MLLLGQYFLDSVCVFSFLSRISLLHQAPELQKIMTRAVRNARAPILFFQAENDYDLSPSRTLSAAIKESGKPFELRIYPPFGKSAAEGHSFGYFGSKVWGGDVFRFLNRYCR